ncbi:MAG: T9SS type A sorting domain-containing protein, partial [Cytophagaceae bacterium]
KSGLDFTGGSPSFLPGGQTDSPTSLEGATNMCDTARNMVFSATGYSLYDGNNIFKQNLNGGTSSTQAGVAVPDPSDPANKFYLFTANVDNGGGGEKPASTVNLGIHYYRIQKLAGGNISVLSGPVKIADNNEVTEQLCGGTDGNGNYWIVAHQGGAFPPGWGLSLIFSWQVTAAGVGSRVTSSMPGTTGNNYWQGAMKINTCQDRLGIVYSDGGSPGSIEIYDWDQTTGKVTALRRRVATGLPNLYGCEFSPDGKILYATSLNGNMLYQLDIASGTVYSDPAWTSSNNRPEMGTMQLGPDGKIYVTNVSNSGLPAYIGVINNPNVAGAGCNYNKTGFTLNSSASFYPNIARGISNIAWTYPNTPVINFNSGICPTIGMDYNFKTYFNSNIAVVPGSEDWDFGEGSGYVSGLGAAPSHTYASNNTFTVKLRFRDQVCNKLWTGTGSVNTCVLPVTWTYTDAEPESEGVRVEWETETETEVDNNYFVIERSSDGIDFEEAGRVNGKGNFNGRSSYLFFDEAPLEGISYYRIRQVDVNGSSSESRTMEVALGGFQFSVLPNPSGHEFKLICRAADKGSVEITDVLGRKILVSELHEDITFGENFPAGTYMVRILAGQKVLCKKIVKL